MIIAGCDKFVTRISEWIDRPAILKTLAWIGLFAVVVRLIDDPAQWSSVWLAASAGFIWAKSGKGQS